MVLLIDKFSFHHSFNNISNRRVRMSVGYIFCRSKILIFILLGRAFLLRFPASPGVGRTMKSGNQHMFYLSRLVRLNHLLEFWLFCRKPARMVKISCTFMHAHVIKKYY